MVLGVPEHVMNVVNMCENSPAQDPRWRRRKLYHQSHLLIVGLVSSATVVVRPTGVIKQIGVISSGKVSILRADKEVT